MPWRTKMHRLRFLGGPGFYPGKIRLTRPPVPDLHNISDRLTSALASGILTKGEQLAEFEAEVTEHLGSRYAIGTSSCTVGLTLSLAALKMINNKTLDQRVEVLIPSFTFLATATATAWAGCDPVFVDVDQRTFNIDIADLEKKVTDKTFAIIFTYVFGSPTGVDQVLNFANSRNIPVIFDAAHGFGVLHNGKTVGNMGLAASYSLTPTKLLTSGEGGFVTTNSEEMANSLRILREYGSVPGVHDTAYPGLNGRMSELHAILGRWGLEQLDTEAIARSKKVAYYKEHLSKVPGIGFQTIAAEDRCSYKDFALKIDANAFGLTRDELWEVMKKEDFECKNYFCPPVHQHQYFNRDGKNFKPGAVDTCPNASELSSQTLCPPLFGTMTDPMQDAVIGAITQAHENAGLIKEKLARSR
jgi:dTDP-4-amino-4,6-dideoxygalactose transaminase